MGRGKITDRRWMGQMVTVFAVINGVHFGINMWVYGFFYWLIFRIPSAPGYPASLPPDYGFWMRGNNSLFAPTGMDRTDLNETSPTYGMWTPPPEWRDHCIASGGSPLSACSYFMYEEYPRFMRFFYIALTVLWVFELLTMAHGFYVSYIGPKSYFRHALKGAHDLSEVLTCWGADRNPNCRQAQSWLGFLQFTLIIFGQVPLTTMINMWYGNGIGLLNAQSSGKWYLGAGWNKDPMIEYPKFMDGWMIFKYILPCWLAPCFPRAAWWFNTGFGMMHDTIFQLGAQPFCEDIMVVSTQHCLGILFTLMVINTMKPMNEKYGIEGQRRFFPTLNKWTLDGIWVAFRNSYVTEPHFILTWGPLAFQLCYSYITLDLAESWWVGEANRLRFVQGMGHVALVATLSGVWMVLTCQLYTFRAFRAQFEHGKKLLSADVFSSRLKKFNRMTRSWSMTWTLFTLWNTLMMPRGMASQAYGLPDASVWHSPMDWIFSQPGATTNLLALPIHRLIGKTAIMYAYATYVMPSIYSVGTNLQLMCGSRTDMMKKLTGGMFAAKNTSKQPHRQQHQSGLWRAWQVHGTAPSKTRLRRGW